MGMWNVVLFIIAIAIGIGLAVLLIKGVRGKIREFSRVLWGTDTIKEGIEKTNMEYAATPKSIAAMTSICLPQIRRDFPDFHFDEMKERAENLLTSYLMGISSMNTAYIRDGNQELKDRLSLYIEMLRNKEWREYYDRVRLHRTEISQYRKKEGRCTITFQSSVQYFHYIMDEKTGKTVKGDQKALFQSRYEVDMIYIQDREIVENELDQALGINCPNCGAPIKSLGAKFCEYCGTGIIEYNIHAWSFSDVREVI